MKVRKSARAIILNENNEVLLFKFIFRNVVEEKVLWVTPGGGLDNHESFQGALLRELEEETGITNFEIGEWLWTRELKIKGKHEDYISYERYYLAHSKEMNDVFTLEKMTENEKSSLIDFRWISIEQLKRMNKEEVAPPDLAELIENISEKSCYYPIAIK